MLFMNECDIVQALQRTAQHAVLHRGARFLEQLAAETNAHSDGWHSWPKPCRAARRLIELIQAGGNPSPQELTKALAPIRSFYTRFGYATGMRFPEIAP